MACWTSWRRRASGAAYGTFLSHILRIPPMCSHTPIFALLLPKRRANDGSCRYALQLLAPASILASLAGRQEVQLEDVGEMGELFLDARSSAAIIEENGDAYIGGQ